MKLNQTAIQRPRIEMLPLVDSFFLILVYFIYAFVSMSVHKGVPLDLPQAATAVIKNEEHVGISITKEGKIFINKVEIDKQGLKKYLEDLKVQMRTKPSVLYIYGDKKASHGDVIEVFDLIRKVGIQKVFIETRREGD